MRIIDLSVTTGPGPGEPLPPAIDSFNAGSGLTRASTTWLLEQGVKVIGTDPDGLHRLPPAGQGRRRLRGLAARPPILEDE